MWEKKFKKSYPGVSKEQVWSRWSDVDTWTDWNEDLEMTKLNDSFEAGGTFILKPKGAPEFKLTLEEVTESKSFTDCLHLPGAKMFGKHEVVETESGIELTTEVSITGMNSMMWVKMLGEKVAGKMEKQMDDLVSVLSK